MDIRNSCETLTSWILGVNIEQHNNAVNAREANTVPLISSVLCLVDLGILTIHQEQISRSTPPYPAMPSLD